MFCKIFESKTCENGGCQRFRGDHLEIQRRIQNPFKHLRCSFFANKVNDYEPPAIFAENSILEIFNPFVPNASFLYPLKTSENRNVFWCFQGVEKGCIGNEWVKWALSALWWTLFGECALFLNVSHLFSLCHAISALTFSWRGSLSYRNQIRANQWTGFYMIRNSVMKELTPQNIQKSVKHLRCSFFTKVFTRFQPTDFNYFRKSCIIDVWIGSECASVASLNPVNMQMYYKCTILKCKRSVTDIERKSSAKNIVIQSHFLVWKFPH